MKGIGGFYYVYVEGSGLYECRARGIFRNKKMKPNVGDVVDIDILSEEEKTGNLVKIHKRKNQLIRPMAANVDQALVIFAVHEPEPNFHLLNRFLITMEQQEIPVIICFNKTDLATTEQMQQLEKDYENSGCQVIFQAAATGEGITQIEELLRGRTTIMAGPSGVGKSSTLNCISKEKQMETGAVSEKIKRGKHTTRHSELIHIGEDTYLMDTPGFSSLFLENIEKEDLKYYFPEFEPYENTCRFNGCCHIHEPGCEVKKALEEGKISKLRYDDYCMFYEDMDIYKLFVEVSDKSVLKDYYNEVLGKLEEYDNEHGSNYLEFLKTYLDNNASPQLVSEKEFIHRNTVVNYLKKIDTITSMNLFDLGVKVKCIIAFAIRDFL